MKEKRFVFFLLCALWLCSATCSAQSTVGTDFWVTFMENHIEYGQLELKLIITGSRNCTGVVSNPNTNWSQNFNVTAGAVTNVTIPEDQAYTTLSETITNTGLHVTSTDSISLYASNFEYASFDVTNVLPTFSLGDDYMIQTYPDMIGWGCEFVIMAVEDQTVVDINLTAQSANGIDPYTTFSITLDAGQCYQLKSYHDHLSDDNFDLSGSQISARDSKKIAVFSGNVGAYVPGVSYGYADHLVEQMMPVTCWGKTFVVTGSCLRTKDRVRITALNDNCTIMKNASVVRRINARETYEFDFNTNIPSCLIETSEPAMVSLYFTGSDYGGEMGDPSMVIINPIEQQISEVTFGTFTTEITEHHFVNITCNAENVSGMRLDGNDISSQFSFIYGNFDYKFARIEVSYGAHTLKNELGGFVAHVYGLGVYESYAYSVGSMAMDIASQLYVNEQNVLFHPNGFDACRNNPVGFAINVNYELSRVEWTFDDGETGTGEEISHVFSSSGDYDVSCNIYRLIDGVENLETTLTTQIHVFDNYETEEFVEACGESYEWQGHAYTQSGTYNESFESIHGCDSIQILHLTLHPVYNVDIEESSCELYTWMGESYDQSGDYRYVGTTSYGCDSIVTLHLTINRSDTTYLNTSACNAYEWFGTTYDEPGEYEHLLESVAGCDSLLILNLSFGDSFSEEYSESACNSYFWRGNTYYESGIYQDTVLSSDGCDSLFILNLDLGYDMMIDTSATACSVFEWNGMEYTATGDYTQTFENVQGCDSIVTLHLTVHPMDTTLLFVTTCGEYEWYGNTYYEVGTYEHLLQSAAGCDSLLVMDLSFVESFSLEYAESACNSYFWRGNTYYESGIYQDTVLSSDGCDSLFILNLDLGFDMMIDTSATACSAFEWNGMEYTATGDYTQTFENVQGCDSIVTLHLELVNMYDVYLDTVHCGAYWFNGQEIETSGYYEGQFVSTDGCDSIVHLQLTVGHFPDVPIMEGQENVFVATDLVTGIYHYEADPVPNATHYEWSLTGADWLMDTIGTSCMLMVIYPGTGILTLRAWNECGYTEVQKVINAGFFDVGEQEAVMVNVYPNPAKNKAVVESEGIMRIRMYSMKGQLLQEINGNGDDRVEVNLRDFAPAPYLLEVMTRNGMANVKLNVVR